MLVVDFKMKCGAEIKNAVIFKGEVKGAYPLSSREEIEKMILIESGEFKSIWGMIPFQTSSVIGKVVRTGIDTYKIKEIRKEDF